MDATNKIRKILIKLEQTTRNALFGKIVAHFVTLNYFKTVVGVLSSKRNHTAPVLMTEASRKAASPVSKENDMNADEWKISISIE